MEKKTEIFDVTLITLAPNWNGAKKALYCGKFFGQYAPLLNEITQFSGNTDQIYDKNLMLFFVEVFLKKTVTSTKEEPLGNNSGQQYIQIKF